MVFTTDVYGSFLPGMRFTTILRRPIVQTMWKDIDLGRGPSKNIINYKPLKLIKWEHNKPGPQ